MLNALANRTPWIVSAIVALALVGAGLIGPREGSQTPAALRVAQPQQPPANANPKREEWRQEQDLRAQWDQAYWAMLAALAGGASVLITGFGVFFIAATLEATRRATETAQSQANAAVENNALLRSAYVTEQRPWLKLDMKIGGSLWLTGGGLHVTIDCDIRNVGRTPAILVWPEIAITDTRLDIGPDNLLKRTVAKAKAMGDGPAGVLIFPGDKSLVSMQASVSSADITRMVADTGELVPKLVAAVRYRSVFDNNTYVTAKSAQVFKSTQTASGEIIPTDVDSIRIADGNIDQHLLRLSEDAYHSSYAD